MNETASQDLRSRVNRLIPDRFGSLAMCKRRVSESERIMFRSSPKRAFAPGSEIERVRSRRCSRADISTVVGAVFDALCVARVARSLVDPASSHMLVSKIKPCMSQYKPH